MLFWIVCAAVASSYVAYAIGRTVEAIQRERRSIEDWHDNHGRDG